MTACTICVLVKITTKTKSSIIILAGVKNMLANSIDPNQTVPKEGVQTVIQTELHLTLATLEKLSRQQTDDTFSRKQALTCHANCLLWR